MVEKDFRTVGHSAKSPERLLPSFLMSKITWDGRNMRPACRMPFSESKEGTASGLAVLAVPLHNPRSYAALYSFSCIIPQAKQKFLLGTVGKGKFLNIGHPHCNRAGLLARIR